MKLRLFFFLAVLFTIINIGCQDNTDNTTDPKVTPNVEVLNGLLSRSNPGDGEIGLACYNISLPFQLVDDQGVVYTITDDTDFTEIYDSTGVGPNIVDFVYPLNLENVNGETAVANNINELSELFAACVPEGGFTGPENFPAYLITFDNSCFELQLPVNLVSENGVVTSASTVDEFNELVASSFQTFGYPITLKNQAGESFTVLSDEELMNLLVSCCDIPNNEGDSILVNGNFFFCYDAQFPLTLVNNAGNNVVVNNNDELINQLIQGDISGFVYPITLVKEDGSTVVVNSDLELSEVLEDCGVIFVDPTGTNSALLLLAGTGLDSIGSEACYTIQFPISTTLTYLDGTTSQIEFVNLESFTNTVFNQQLLNADVSFPVTITLTDNNQTIVVTSLEQLLEIITNCQ